MSQLPQNNEDFDNNPEDAKLYQADDSQQPETDGTDDWEQPASEQPPAVQGTQDGKRAANFSLLFGFLSPLSFVLGFRWSAYGYEIGSLLALTAPLLNILGIWQAFVARRYGKRAIGGLLLNGLGLCIFIGIVALIIMILSALSGLNDSGPSRTLNAERSYAVLELASRTQNLEHEKPRSSCELRPETWTL